jgi:hypothetical protein
MEGDTVTKKVLLVLLIIVSVAFASYAAWQETRTGQAREPPVADQVLALLNNAAFAIRAGHCGTVMRGEGYIDCEDVWVDNNTASTIHVESFTVTSDNPDLTVFGSIEPWDEILPYTGVGAHVSVAAVASAGPGPFWIDIEVTASGESWQETQTARMGIIVAMVCLSDDTIFILPCNGWDKVLFPPERLWVAEDDLPRVYKNVGWVDRIVWREVTTGLFIGSPPGDDDPDVLIDKYALVFKDAPMPPAVKITEAKYLLPCPPTSMSCYLPMVVRLTPHTPAPAVFLQQPQ